MRPPICGDESVTNGQATKKRAETARFAQEQLEESDAPRRRG
jgi:hypothetical protein